MTATKRMALSAVIKGKQSRAWRILLYGTEGIGKSTFASQCPAPIFLGAEDGTAHLDVVRFPSPQNWDDMRAAVQTLVADEHQYKTLVVDTVDWAEPLLWDFICRRDKKQNIEDYGYGKGYQAALDEWRIFLSQLEKLREKNINVLLLGHSQLKLFKNPEGEDFDRYELKLNLKAGGLIKEWCDAVLFARHEMDATKDKKTNRVRGISTGARLLHSEKTAAYDAKNRFNLPAVMTFSYADFESALAGASIDSAQLIAEIKNKTALIRDADKDKVHAAITRAGGDVSKLLQLNAWVNGQPRVNTEAQTQKEN